MTVSNDDFSALLNEELEMVRTLLVAKNQSYGNSALEPIRVFSQADTLAQIKVRIDDKLKRIQSGKVFGDEDTVLDLIGYLFILRIAMRNQ